MRAKSLVFAAGVMLMASLPAGAATFTTPDGVLSIETPSDSWVQQSDPDTWFVLSDGSCMIEIDHLSNGEMLPGVQAPSDGREMSCQAFITMNNDVFAIKATAQSREELTELIKMLGSVTIPESGTAPAVQNETPASSVSEYGLRAINALYNVATDELNLRSSYDIDSAVLDVLEKGDQVLVTGAVTKNGSDYGWYQVEYDGETAYASSSFLVPDAAGSSSDSFAAAAGSSSDSAAAGSSSGSTAGGSSSDSSSADSQEIICEYCGEWFTAGNDYRNHVLAAHLNNDNSREEDSDDGETMVQCEYCGAYFSPGEEYEDHIARHLDGSYDEENLIQCEYCGEWFQAGPEYSGHVSIAHSEEQ